MTSESDSPLRTWWHRTDEVSRKRCQQLLPSDHLPEDLALDLQFHHVRVIAIGVVWDDLDRCWRGLYEQPPELTALLMQFTDRDDPHE